MPRTAILTAHAPAAIGPYSQAIRADGYLFCSGQLGLGPDVPGNEIAGRGIQAQLAGAEQVAVGADRLAVRPDGGGGLRGRDGGAGHQVPPWAVVSAGRLGSAETPGSPTMIRVAVTKGGRAPGATRSSAASASRTRAAAASAAPIEG